MMPSREIIRKITADGWELNRTRGDHRQYKHATRPGLVTVPHPVKDVPRRVIRSIERQSGTKLM